MPEEAGEGQAPGFDYGDWEHADPLCWDCGQPASEVRWCPECSSGDAGGPMCEDCAEYHWSTEHADAEGD